MKLSILPLSQNDPRWKSKKYDGIDGTMGRYACNLVCQTMFLRYLGQDILPDALNEIYKSKGVYDKNGLINFYAAGEAFANTWTAEEFYQCMDVPCDLSKIDKLLDQKMPVIAMVDFDANPATTGDWHFVLIIGKENDSYLINDPYTGETYFFEAKYGDPAKMIYGLRIYKGKEVPNGLSCEDKLAKAEITVSSLTDENSRLGLENDELRKALKTEEREHNETKEELGQVRNQRDTAVREKGELEQKVKPLEEQVASLKEGSVGKDEEIKSLKVALKASQEGNLTNLSINELIAEIVRRIFSKKL